MDLKTIIKDDVVLGSDKKRVFSEQHRKKLSLARIGLHPSVETRNKMRLAKMDVFGENNPFYGKNHSDETKEKMRLAHLGMHLSEDSKKKLCLINKGRKHSDDVKRRISECKKGKCSEKLRKHLLKLAISQRGVSRGECSEDHKRKLSLAHIGKKCSDETRNKMRAARVGWTWSEDVKRKIKEGNLKPETLKLHRFNAHKILVGRRNTDIERKVASQLDELGAVYVQQYGLEGRYYYDFFVLNKGVLIECDGDYWHSFEKAKIRDAEKDECAKKYGLNVVRIMGSRISDKNFDLGDYIGR